jgi:hypothetical protein
MGRLIKRFAPLIYNQWERRRFFDKFENRKRVAPGDDAAAKDFRENLQELSDFEEAIRTGNCFGVPDSGAREFLTP